MSFSMKPLSCAPILHFPCWRCKVFQQGGRSWTFHNSQPLQEQAVTGMILLISMCFIWEELFSEEAPAILIKLCQLIDGNLAMGTRQCANHLNRNTVVFPMRIPLSFRIRNFPIFDTYNDVFHLFFGFLVSLHQSKCTKCCVRCDVR